MGFYPELLDTAWVGTEERAAGMALLKLRALATQPCELTTTHAISSHLILDDCADDPYFRGLVEAGRIRFRLRPGGKGARQALIDGLANPSYRLDDWPGIWPTPESADWQDALELRRQAIAWLEDRTRKTDHDELTARLTRCTALFESIEKANYLKQERRHGPMFADLLVKAEQLVPKTHPELRLVFGRLRQKGRLDRSAAYSAIEEDPECGADLERLAKGVVDAMYSSAVAWALEEKLLSVERDVKLAGGHHLGGVPPRESQITLVTSDMGDFDDIAIAWKDVYAATSDAHRRPISKTDRTIAVNKLGQALGEQRVAIRGRELSAAVGQAVVGASSFLGGSTAVAKWIVPTMSGSLGAWSVALAGAVAALTGIKVAASVSQNLTKMSKKADEARIAKQINGWLDHLDDDDAQNKARDKS